MDNAEQERVRALFPFIASTAPHPDARLIAACERLLFLDDEVRLLYRKTPRGYLQRCRATAPERDALEVEIAKTPARTMLGRLAKAELAMRVLSETGTSTRIGRSVLTDFISNASAQESAA